MNRHDAISNLSQSVPLVIERLNSFSRRVLLLRGGERIGSGLGLLLEALWGFCTNKLLGPSGIEIAWLGHQYNDFACLEAGAEWNNGTRAGEFFRVEVKSMNIQAEESKGHFDQLVEEIGEYDQLLILLWEWRRNADLGENPIVLDYFFRNARKVAELRDRLHVARGGSFVDRASCPDGCAPRNCTHHGEPLNEAGKRERKPGPESRRVSGTTLFASNFGGLVRMLKSNSDAARQEFVDLRRSDDTMHDYITFIHRNFPSEEFNQYPFDFWVRVAESLGLSVAGLSKKEVVEKVRTRRNYMSVLRTTPA